MLAWRRRVVRASSSCVGNMAVEARFIRESVWESGGSDPSEGRRSEPWTICS